MSLKVPNQWVVNAFVAGQVPATRGITTVGRRRNLVQINAELDHLVSASNPQINAFHSAIRGEVRRPVYQRAAFSALLIWRAGERSVGTRRAGPTVPYHMLPKLDL